MKRAVRVVFISGLVLGLIGACMGIVFGLYIYFRLTADLPKIDRIGDYQPKAVTSILAEDGTLLGELFEERRYPVTFNEIPLVVRNAFLAAEDANFYSHPGIDFVSVLRAIVVNFRRKSVSQGASTITQQLVKQLLLTKERTYERKVKEAILSYRLEKRLTKDEILSIYLNHIFLGAGAYGVKAAAKVLFHQELKDVTIAEAAFLAGLPKKPTFYARPEHKKDAIDRQRYVLRQMFENGMITDEELEAAKNTPITIYPADQRTLYEAPYFTSHVIRELDTVFQTLGPGVGAMDPGGFVVETTANVAANRLAQRALRHGLRAVERRQGYRGAFGRVGDKKVEGLLLEGEVKVVSDELYLGVVDKVDTAAQVVTARIGDTRGRIDLKKQSWARQLKASDSVRTIRLEQYFREGDVIEVSLDAELTKRTKTGKVKELWLELDQTPVLEGAFVSMNAISGAVPAIVGGFDFNKSQFNRATQALRQPGSSFKPIVYLTAIDELGYTPSTLVPDSPISLVGGDGKLWNPQNYDRKFLGPITLRTALEKSRNVVSVYLVKRVTPEKVVATARRLGITTDIRADYSIALGSYEVKMLELIRAYSVFAGGGYLPDLWLVTSVTDRHGKKIYKQFPKQRQVVSAESAFLMANIMKGVVERGTATSVKPINRPVAGKTGTTNEQMDAWFIGYTPEWVTGVWVGYDEKRTIGRMETGGKAAAPIFLEYMQQFLKDEPVDDFPIPDGVIPMWVNRNSGHLVSSDTPGAFLEYFKSGTEPTSFAEEEDTTEDYLTNREF